MENHWDALLSSPKKSGTSRKRVAHKEEGVPVETHPAAPVKKLRFNDQIEVFCTNRNGKSHTKKVFLNGKKHPVETSTCKSSVASVTTTTTPPASSLTPPQRLTPLIQLPSPTPGPCGVPMMSLADAEVLSKALRPTPDASKEKEEEEACEENNSSDADGIVDAEGLQRHLESIRYKVPKGIKRVPWVETLSITVNRFVEEGEEPIDPTSGIKLENTFVEISRLGIREALRRLSLLQVPFTRPSDYYAEMLKSDHQMFKVRRQLEEETTRIKTVEARKKHQAEKKFAKKVQAERIKQKQQEKNKNLKKIEEWKKSKFKTAL